jgi:hypothetical protein
VQSGGLQREVRAPLEGGVADRDRVVPVGAHLGQALRPVGIQNDPRSAITCLATG